MLSRRTFVAGATVAAAALTSGARAQAGEISIGAIWPFSGANAHIGVDARFAMETALDIINNDHPDLDLPLAKGTGLAGMGGAKIKLVTADHASDPQKGRAEAERLITQDKVAAIPGHLPELGRVHRHASDGALQRAVSWPPTARRRA
jgi:branched-chain amino acid transport system substrate-binding protein